MARNRKSQSAAIRFGPALKALLLCLLIGGAGVGYVWQKEQIAKLAHQQKEKESTLAELEKQNGLLRKQLAKIHSPQYLEARIKDSNLGLVPPLPTQILRLTEPVPETPRANHEPQYASRGEARALEP